MRQRATKVWTSMLLALVLVASTLFALPGAHAMDHQVDASETQIEVPVGHSHTHPAQCGKTAHCEASVALLTYQRPSMAENAGKLMFVPSEPGRNSTILEAQLPPPKA